MQVNVTIDLNYLHYKKVMKTLDDGTNRRNKIALRKSCIANQKIFPIGGETFRGYLCKEKFNVEQQKYIWDYILANHPEKAKAYFDTLKQTSTSVQLQAA